VEAEGVGKAVEQAMIGPQMPSGRQTVLTLLHLLVACLCGHLGSAAHGYVY